MNPLYNMMQSQNNNMIQRFQQFRNSINGDPQKMVNDLLKSGKVTQEQYNNAVRTVNQIRGMFGV